MALMEIDEVAVNRYLYEQAKSGDQQAQQKLRTLLDGLVLYLHAMPVDGQEKVVTIRQLQEIGVIDSIKVTMS